MLRKKHYKHRQKSDDLFGIETENWIKSAWRPAMGWAYLIICLFDFIIAPSITWVFFYYTKTPFQAWDPLTLKAGGFFHLSMGAILGITSWQRSNERMTFMNNGIGMNNNGMNNNGMGNVQPGYQPNYQPQPQYNVNRPPQVNKPPLAPQNPAVAPPRGTNEANITPPE